MGNRKGFECNDPISKETSKFSHENMIKNKALLMMRILWLKSREKNLAYIF